jgi:lysophospholipase L1-like esterase
MSLPSDNKSTLMYWYEDEVRRLERDRDKEEKTPEILFYGSSSIRQWEDLAQDFPEHNVANLGFGGSTLAACVWFFERIMFHYQPKVLFIYAGDNDLGDGRNPEEIFIFFQQLMVKVALRFGNIPCYFISLKPSITRWHLADQFSYTNNLIESEIIKLQTNWKFINVYKAMLTKSGEPNQGFYEPDGLHLNKTGYELWKNTIQSYLNE